MARRFFIIPSLVFFLMMTMIISMGVLMMIPSAHAAEDGAFTNPLNTTNPFAIAANAQEKDNKLAAAVQPWARIVRLIVSTLGVVMFLMIVWGGFQYLTAAGEAERAEMGMKTVLWAALGGGVILASYALAAWLVLPLGGIFGLNTGPSSSGGGGNGDVNNKNGATFACCKFQLDDGKEIKCKEIRYAATKDCQSTNPFFGANYPMVMTFNPMLSKASPDYTLVEERPGVHCGEVSGCTTGNIAEPTGCCRATKAIWGGLRCKDELTQSECTGIAAQGVITQWDQSACSTFPSVCSTWKGCCQYAKAGGSTQCVNVDYDGDGVTYTQVCNDELARNSQLSGYQFKSSLGGRNSTTCAEHTTECTDIIQQSTIPDNGGILPSSPASQECCVPDPSFNWNNLNYSNNRGVCFPPTQVVGQAPTCTSGWTFRSQPCSAFPVECTKLQANPPLPPSGCCYWKDAGQPLMRTQRISESLCKADHPPVFGQRETRFREAGLPIEPATFSNGPRDVDCVGP